MPMRVDNCGTNYMRLGQQDDHHNCNDGDAQNKSNKKPEFQEATFLNETTPQQLSWNQFQSLCKGRFTQAEMSSAWKAYKATKQLPHGIGCNQGLIDTSTSDFTTQQTHPIQHTLTTATITSATRKLQHPPHMPVGKDLHAHDEADRQAGPYLESIASGNTITHQPQLEVCSSLLQRHQQLILRDEIHSQGQSHSEALKQPCRPANHTTDISKLQGQQPTPTANNTDDEESASLPPVYTPTVMNASATPTAAATTAAAPIAPTTTTALSIQGRPVAPSWGTDATVVAQRQAAIATAVSAQADADAAAAAVAAAYAYLASANGQQHRKQSNTQMVQMGTGHPHLLPTQQQVRQQGGHDQGVAQTSTSSHNQTLRAKLKGAYKKAKKLLGFKSSKGGGMTNSTCSSNSTQQLLGASCPKPALSAPCGAVSSGSTFSHSAQFVGLAPALCSHPDLEAAEGGSGQHPWQLYSSRSSSNGQAWKQTVPAPQVAAPSAAHQALRCSAAAAVPAATVAPTTTTNNVTGACNSPKTCAASAAADSDTWHTVGGSAWSGGHSAATGGHSRTYLSCAHASEVACGRHTHQSGCGQQLPEGRGVAGAEAWVEARQRPCLDLTTDTDEATSSFRPLEHDSKAPKQVWASSGGGGGGGGASHFGDLGSVQANTGAGSSTGSEGASHVRASAAWVQGGLRHPPAPAAAPEMTTASTPAPSPPRHDQAHSGEPSQSHTRPGSSPGLPLTKLAHNQHAVQQHGEGAAGLLPATPSAPAKQGPHAAGVSKQSSAARHSFGDPILSPEQSDSGHNKSSIQAVQQSTAAPQAPQAAPHMPPSLWAVVSRAAALTGHTKALPGQPYAAEPWKGGAASDDSQGGVMAEGARAAVSAATANKVGKMQADREGAGNTVRVENASAGAGKSRVGGVGGSGGSLGSNGGNSNNGSTGVKKKGKGPAVTTLAAAGFAGSAPHPDIARLPTYEEVVAELKAKRRKKAGLARRLLRAAGGPGASLGEAVARGDLTPDGYGDYKPKLPREYAPHNHEWFRGFGPWVEVTGISARHFRAKVPRLPGVYEWGARAPGPRSQLSVFYLGKAGVAGKHEATLRQRLSAYVVGTCSWIGPRLEGPAKMSMFMELQRRGFSLFAWWCECEPGQDAKTLESELLAHVDYAANERENGRRRRIILGGGADLTDFPVLMNDSGALPPPALPAPAPPAPTRADRTGGPDRARRAVVVVA